MAGKCLIFSAPSGSGKSTIVQWLTREHPELNLAFSISATSRPPRGTEQHGIEYFFLTPEEFKQKINDNEFLEYEEVYTNRYYGTLKGQIEELLRNGKNVIFDIDIKGGLNIKKYFGERALAIFIQPPGVDELRKRLVGRATDSQEQIEERLGKAEYEMSFASQFDTIIINDDLDIAKSETLTTIQKFLKDSNTFWQQYSV
ncbi:MAG: guanylate kinase [Bacteroidaceae bacterium]|jgi:guanylate kinase|nr:guanylate kinase [Bacteroidaceae bacterium]